MQNKKRLFIAVGVSVPLMIGIVAYALNLGESRLVRPRLAEVIAATSMCQSAVSEAFENAGQTAPALDKVNCDAKVAGQHASVRARSDGVIEITALYRTCE